MNESELMDDLKDRLYHTGDADLEQAMFEYFLKKPGWWYQGMEEHEAWESFVGDMRHRKNSQTLCEEFLPIYREIVRRRNHENRN